MELCVCVCVRLCWGRVKMKSVPDPDPDLTPSKPITTSKQMPQHNYLNPSISHIGRPIIALLPVPQVGSTVA